MKTVKLIFLVATIVLFYSCEKKETNRRGTRQTILKVNGYIHKKAL